MTDEQAAWENYTINWKKWKVSIFSGCDEPYRGKHRLGLDITICGINNKQCNMDSCPRFTYETVEDRAKYVENKVKCNDIWD